MPTGCLQPHHCRRRSGPRKRRKKTYGPRMHPLRQRRSPHVSYGSNPDDTRPQPKSITLLRSFHKREFHCKNALDFRESTCWCNLPNRPITLYTLYLLETHWHIPLQPTPPISDTTKNDFGFPLPKSFFIFSISKFHDLPSCAQSLFHQRHTLRHSFHQAPRSYTAA